MSTKNPVESLRAQILFMESWRNFWRERAANTSAAEMAERVLRTLRAADEPPAAPPASNLRLGMDTPWPLPDVLAKLIEATEHLLDRHSCDVHGHEEFQTAASYAKAYLATLRCEHRDQRQGERGPPYCADCGEQVPEALRPVETSDEPVAYCVEASHDGSLSPPTKYREHAQEYALDKATVHPSIRWTVVPLYRRVVKTSAGETGARLRELPLDGLESWSLRPNGRKCELSLWFETVDTATLARERIRLHFGVLDASPEKTSAGETTCVGCAQGWHRQDGYPNPDARVHCPPPFIACTAPKTDGEPGA